MSGITKDHSEPSDPVDVYEAPRVVVIGSLEELTEGSASEGSDVGSFSVL